MEKNLLIEIFLFYNKTAIDENIKVTSQISFFIHLTFQIFKHYLFEIFIYVQQVVEGRIPTSKSSVFLSRPQFVPLASMC